MDSIGRAVQDLNKYHKLEIALENELIDSLNNPDAVSKGSMRTPQAIDAELNELRQQMEETTAMIDFQQKQCHVMNVADLRQICYTSQRVMAVPSSSSALESTSDKQQKQSAPQEPLVTNDDLIPFIVQWSDRNYRAGITGMLLATNKSFFGILEGPSVAVTELFERSIMRSDKSGKIQHSCMLLRTMAVEARQFSSGLQLQEMPDGVISSVMEYIQANTFSARVYCPPPTVSLLERGGDPLQVAPKTGVFYVMSCALDSLCGAVHHIDRFQAAAERFEQIVLGINDGIIAERFGSQMVALFPKVGTPAAIIQGAKDFISDIPFAVVAISCGVVNLSSLPTVIACGPGLRDNIKLLYFCEHARRPLVITEPVYDACSKAVHRFDDFTVDNVRYCTLQSLTNTRLQVAPEADMPYMRPYVPGSDSVPARTKDNTNPNIILPPTPDEVNEGRKAAAVVRGSLTDNEMRGKFRLLDVGNVGWVSKDSFRKHVASETAFPLFGHDLKKMEQWLDRCNSLGDSRLSFSEFSLLMLRLQQQ